MTIRFPHLNIQLNGVPSYYEILGVRITIMGILMTAAMLLGLLILILEAKRRKQSVNRTLGAAIFSVLGGLLGARALYVACHWAEYRGDVLRMLNFREGGMVLLGGILGGLLLGWLFCLCTRTPFGEAADTLSITLVLGQVLVRFGDFFGRQSFGGYTDTAFAMQLPLAGVRSSELTDAIRANLVEVGGIPYIQVHPTFLYESVACLLLFFVMLGVNRRKRFAGQTLLTYLTWYGLIRLVIQYLRTDKLMVPGVDFSLAELFGWKINLTVDLVMILSLGMFLVFGVVGGIRGGMAKKRVQARRERQEKRYEEEERAGEEFDRQEEERERRLREIAKERLEANGETSAPEGEEGAEGREAGDAPVSDVLSAEAGVEGAEESTEAAPEAEEDAGKATEVAETSETAEVSRPAEGNPAFPLDEGLVSSEMAAEIVTPAEEEAAEIEEIAGTKEAEVDISEEKTNSTEENDRSNVE